MDKLSNGDEQRGFGATIKVTDTVASPDGEYVATTYLESGGNEYGWCFQRVCINTKASPFTEEKIKKRGGFNFDITCKSKVDLHWQSNRELLINYSGISDEAGLSIFQKPMSEDRQVRVTYLPKP